MRCATKSPRRQTYILCRLSATKYSTRDVLSCAKSALPASLTDMTLSDRLGVASFTSAHQFVLCSHSRLSGADRARTASRWPDADIPLIRSDAATKTASNTYSVKSPRREQDFGIDFFCEPRVRTGPQTETVTELSAIQVKGGNERLTYGGIDRRGRWREYEFAWLQSLAVPLYLARVSRALDCVELFSFWPMWLIFWRQSELPFEVTFQTGSVQEWSMPTYRKSPIGQSYGDGLRWTVPLGAPILRLTDDDLSRESAALFTDILDFPARVLAILGRSGR
jgi:hypothetical protein